MARTEGLWERIVGSTAIQPVGSSGVDILLKGSNHYINFDTNVGSDGYGFRDNSGTMQFKNSGGAWTDVGAGGVSKVGTPVDNQIGVWTGDGTLEGDANFTWDGSTLAITGGQSLTDSLLVTGAAFNDLAIAGANDTDTGIYWAGSNILGFSAGSSGRFTFNAVLGLVPEGSATQLAIRADNDTNTGIAFGGATVADTIYLTTGGTGRITINNSGAAFDNATASTIASFDGSKILTSLSTATYPSLAELAHVKGVTSAIQTQIDAKGEGDVVGPASSTDNALAVFDSTTGKLLKNSGVFYDASVAATGPGLSYDGAGGGGLLLDDENNVALISDVDYASFIYVATSSGIQIESNLNKGIHFGTADKLFEFGGYSSASTNGGILDFSSIATSDKTFTFPNTTGTIALTSDLIAYATTALDNLASVAINTSLISDTDSTDDLGSASIAWANLYVDTIRSATGNALNITPVAGSNLNVNLSTTGDFAVNTDQLYVDTSTGNVGIGTDSPDSKLDVEGSAVASRGVINATNDSFSSGTDTPTINARFFTTDGSTIGSVSMGKFGGSNNGVGLRFQQVEGTDRLVFRGSSTAGAMVWSQPEASAKLLMDFAGSRTYEFTSDRFTAETSSINLGSTDNPWDTLFVNTVGIGDTSPSFPLDVAGKIGIDGTQMLYYPQGDFTGTLVLGDGGQNLSYTSGDDGRYNTFIGIGSGSANTTGGFNTANGYRSLFSNTTGNYNTANGREALLSNTTGNQNTANGSQSIRNNTEGSYNIANGNLSLYFNTTGNQNTANGYASLFYNNTGSYNIAQGYNSGRYIADGTTGRTTGNYGLYLGYNSKASADGTTNEIVIGYNAIGNGSNTVTLGSDSITDTLLKGDVGMGTDSPYTKLHVVESTVTNLHRISEVSTLIEGSEGVLQFGAADSGSYAGALVLTSAPSTGDNKHWGMFAGGPNVDNKFSIRYGTSSGDVGLVAAFNATELLTIDTDGNVGIGTTSPTAVLHLKAGTSSANTAPLKFTAGTSLTTPEDGTFEYDGSAPLFTTAGVRRAITLGNDTRLEDLTVTNTTTETTIHTSSVIADEMKAGKMYKITLLGKTSTASASDFYTLRFKMGGTTLITVAMTAKNVADEHFRSEFYLTIRTIGASGTYAAHVEGAIGAEVITATPVTGSVDTTVAEDLVTTAQWDGANAGNILTIMQSVLEVIN